MKAKYNTVNFYIESYPILLFLNTIKVCPEQRKSVVFYASQQCKEWGKLLSQSGKSAVELLPEGRQIKHQPVKGSWLSCAIFCKVIIITFVTRVKLILETNWNDNILNCF